MRSSSSPDGRRDTSRTAPVQVVYESQFGNVAHVAEAVAAVLGVAAQAVSADGPELRNDTELLIVAAPTHMLTMSTRLTRWIAQRSGGRGGRGMRDWLADVRLQDVDAVAVFGTQSSRVSGSATRSLVRHARRRDVPVIGSAEFIVSRQAGPLVAGELERARAWAQAMSATLH